MNGYYVGTRDTGTVLALSKRWCQGVPQRSGKITQAFLNGPPPTLQTFTVTPSVKFPCWFTIPVHFVDRISSPKPVATARWRRGKRPKGHEA